MTQLEFDLSAADLASLEVVHKYSSYHRELINGSAIVGCFYCIERFVPSDIKEWIDGGDTAICPNCGIDSVLPEILGIVPTQELLMRMHEYWFAFGEDDE